MGCNWVQGLGSNPINQLAEKYKLRTAKTNGDDFVTYSEKGKINGTASYNRMNERYEVLTEMTSKYLY
jgi:polyamine oxidase